MEATNSSKKTSIGRKILKIALRTVIIIIILVTSLALLILTPPVQNFARKKAQTYLSNKLNTKVEIGRIYIGFPKKIVLENIYVEDLKKDTLLSAGKLKVDISMLKLLNSEIEVSQVELSQITAKIKRTLPDTTYNFQFIVDAFASKKDPEPASTDTSSMKISVRDIILDKIRLVYDDVVTGNDVTVWLEHFDTNIKTFDPANMHFDVPITRIRGLNTRIYQKKPLTAPVVASADSSKAADPIPFRFSFDKIQLDDIGLDYGNEVSALYTKLNLGKLEINADDIDLQNQVITLKNIQLNNTVASVRMGRKEAEKAIAKKTENVGEEAKSGWRVYVKNIDLNENDIAFDNDNDPVLKNGMDYSHINAKGITLHADNFIYTPDSIGGSVTKGQLAEKSGFRLNTFETNFLYANNEAYLKDLLIETPGTTLRRSVVLRYPSIDSLKKNIGSLKLDVDLNESKIRVKDILTFAPFLSNQPALANPSAVWLLNGKVNGSVSRLNIEQLQIKGLSDTRADIRGNITGLPDAKKLSGNLVIRSFRTSRKDIQAMVPKGTLPANITLPEIVNVSGSLSGSMANARANLGMSTNLGSVSVDGTIKNATDKNRAVYNAKIGARQLDLGLIMQDDSTYGPVSANFVASGTGFDIKTASANIKGTIASAVFRKYEYRNVQLGGILARQKASFNLNINDRNIHMALDGKSDLSGKFPSIVINAVIDSVKTMPLHFTKDPLVYTGKINADFPVTDPANLQGELMIAKSILTTKDQRFALDSIGLSAGRSDSGQFIRMRSDAINMAITGKYNLAQLGSVFQQAIQPYYAIVPNYKADTIDDYDFNFVVRVIDGPLLKAFMPTPGRLDPIDIKGHFASQTGWQTTVKAPLIITGTNRIQNFNLKAGTASGAINIKAGVEQFSSGTSMIIYTTGIDARIADNKINFLVAIKDKIDKNKYRLGGIFGLADSTTYSLALNPDSLMLNYEKWSIAKSNLVKLNKGDIHITDFTISKGSQQLSLNSTSPETNSPLEVKFGNFRIGTVTAFAKQDSLLADGTINGQVLVKDIVTQPTFTSDLTVNDLTIRQDTVGNLALQVSNTANNVFNAKITVSGKDNDIELKGDYTVKPDNQSVIDLDMDIRKLQMTSLQALSAGAITRATGFINGKFVIRGTFEKPDVNGNLDFNQTGFSPSMLGSYFTIDKERISIDNEGISFDNFTIRDSLKNDLNLDGNAYTTNFINYKFDLDLTADNFAALNSTKQNNKIFYGKFFFDTDLHISGTEAKPIVDGDLKVNDNTRLTIVLPQQEPGVVDREGIIRFIDLDSLNRDTTLLFASYDSVKKSSFTGMDISVNIEVDKSAEFSLIVDEANGDFLRMKGAAQLTGGIDPSGKTTLVGSYEIEEGSYDLSFNLLKRKFLINKGSKIVWLGEPTRANVTLTAVYITNTAPLTLVENQNNLSNINIYKQKLPFQVNLIVSGELLKPEIKFDVILPSDKNYNVDASVIDNVEARLTQLRSEPSELNKQVFALLLLNRFVSENPFASSGGGGFNTESAVRQSVSKILTEQLNNLATDLVKGVDLNFDLASSDDYTTGNMENRTDLNVSLSKQLLNDRLKVTVGSNFELEGPQNSTQKSNNLAGNVALDYMLSKDGRYMIRAYRKNEYEGELDGYIIETGMNFIITLDYNRFRELFHLPKQQKRRKRIDDSPAEADTRKAGPVTVPVIND